MEDTRALRRNCNVRSRDRSHFDFGLALHSQSWSACRVGSARTCCGQQSDRVISRWQFLTIPSLPNFVTSVAGLFEYAGRMRWWVVLVTTLCGCDAVFGLDDTSLPKCLPKQFDEAPATAIIADVEAFSFTSNRQFGVVSTIGQPLETFMPQANEQDLTLVPLEPPYVMVSIAMEPNSKFLFFTAAIEPFQIFTARPTGDPAPNNWALEKTAPKGYIAGTPTDERTGDPVRVVVRLFHVTRDE